MKPAGVFNTFEPDRALNDGDVLDFAGGLEVIHTPGHTAGHVSLLWKRDRGLLITGDAAANIMGLDYMLGCDDFTAGKASLARLAGSVSPFTLMILSLPCPWPISFLKS